MASKVKIKNGVAVAVYDDRWRPILEALGRMNVRRATQVEFDPATGDWVAVHLESGREIARGKVRAEVIRAEVEFLEREVI